MRHGDLSLTVNQRKLACVLDPALVLGDARGPTLALRLTRVFESWLPRSFWHVLDASDLLQPPSGVRPADGAWPVDPHALTAWTTLRDCTDAASWTLRWVGDNLPESQVGDEAEPDLVERYERLVAGLGERMRCRDSDGGVWAHGLDPLAGAVDTLALSACLDGALVLCRRPAGTDADPWPVQALARAGLPAGRLDPVRDDTLFSAERQLVRDALASAGLAIVADGLAGLAVLHVWLDPRASLDGDADACDPWTDAKARWYLV